MFKLSFAAALLYGTAFAQTETDGSEHRVTYDSIRNLFGEDANEDVLKALSIPSEERIQQVETYWTEQNDQRCQDLFTKLISIRREINVKIAEYEDVHNDYERYCKELIIIIYFHR